MHRTGGPGGGPPDRTPQSRITVWQTSSSRARRAARARVPRRLADRCRARVRLVLAVTLSLSSSRRGPGPAGGGRARGAWPWGSTTVDAARDRPTTLDGPVDATRDPHPASKPSSIRISVFSAIRARRRRDTRGTRVLRAERWPLRDVQHKELFGIFTSTSLKRAPSHGPNGRVAPRTAPACAVYRTDARADEPSASRDAPSSSNTEKPVRVRTTRGATHLQSSARHREPPRPSSLAHTHPHPCPRIGRSARSSIHPSR